MKLNLIRKYSTDFISFLIPSVIYIVPAIACYLLITCGNIYIQALSIFLSPLIYAFVFALTAGIISLPSHSGIIPGRFPRQTTDRVYSKRKIYGTCWTTVFYCKPVYFLILNTEFIRKMTFRLFGYKGNLDFRIYADCYIRDLRVLNFGKNAYIASDCTLGSNICNPDGSISVDKISIGENSLVGTKSMLAPGTKVGNNSEIGVGTASGFKVTIGNNVNVGPMCKLGHLSRIGNNVQIGTDAYIGTEVVIHDNVIIPYGAIIPDKAVITSSDDVFKFEQRVPRTV